MLYENPKILTSLLSKMPIGGVAPARAGSVAKPATKMTAAKIINIPDVAKTVHPLLPTVTLPANPRIAPTTMKDRAA